MKEILESADRISGELVHQLQRVGVLSCVVRLHEGEARIIAPAHSYKDLALMLYRMADEMASRAASESSAKH